MHRSIRYTILGASLVAAMLSLAAGRALADGADYMPMRQGATWYYEAKANGVSVKMTLRVSSVQEANGRKVAEYVTSGGPKSVKEWMGSSSEGLYRIQYEEQDVTPPLQVLRLPVTSSAKWSSDVQMGGLRATARFVETTEKVTVPLGTFSAVLVTSELDAAGSHITDRKWFVSGIGLVKEETQMPGALILMELSKYVPGK